MNLQNLIEIVSIVSGVSEHDIRGRERYRKFIIPRYVFNYVARDILGITYMEIAKYMNNDHSTIIYSVNKVKTLIEVKDEIILPTLEKVVNEVTKLMGQPVKVTFVFDSYNEVNTAVIDICKRYKAKVDNINIKCL